MQTVELSCQTRQLIWCLLLVGSTIGLVSGHRTVDLDTVINGRVNCSRHKEILEDCSLLQGYSLRLQEYGWPHNESALEDSCKRNSDSKQCFHDYADCLTTRRRLQARDVFFARSRFIRNVCFDRPKRLINGLFDLAQCIHKHKLNATKKAERKAAAMAEAIVRQGDSFRNSPGRFKLKHACCTMALVKKEFNDVLKPECENSSWIMAKYVESQFGQRAIRLCPDLNSAETIEECGKLSKFPESKPISKSYIMPMIEMNFLADEDAREKPDEYTTTSRSPPTREPLYR